MRSLLLSCAAALIAGCREEETGQTAGPPRPLGVESSDVREVADVERARIGCYRVTFPDGASASSQRPDSLFAAGIALRLDSVAIPSGQLEAVVLSPRLSADAIQGASWSVGAPDSLTIMISRGLHGEALQLQFSGSGEVITGIGEQVPGLRGPPLSANARAQLSRVSCEASQ
jgi:hypothetical protein